MTRRNTQISGILKPQYHQKKKINDILLVIGIKLTEFTDNLNVDANRVLSITLRFIACTCMSSTEIKQYKRMKRFIKVQFGKDMLETSGGNT
jgi:hypothetical protein